MGLFHPGVIEDGQDVLAQIGEDKVATHGR